MRYSPERFYRYSTRVFGTARVDLNRQVQNTGHRSLFYQYRKYSKHSRPQRLRSIWPAPWIETSGRLQFSVRDSRTSDRSAQSRAFIKMVDQAINFGQEIQNFSDITLKEKQYEVLKLLVVEEKDVLTVLPTGYGKSLIYYLLPPV